MTAIPTLDQSAAEIREWRETHAVPGLVNITDRIAAEMTRRLPDIPRHTIGIVALEFARIAGDLGRGLGENVDKPGSVATIANTLGMVAERLYAGGAS